LKIWGKIKKISMAFIFPGALEKKYPNTGKEWALRGGFHAE